MDWTEFNKRFPTEESCRNYLFKKKISLISHTNVRKEILITHMANQSNTKRKNYTY